MFFTTARVFRLVTKMGNGLAEADGYEPRNENAASAFPADSGRCMSFQAQSLEQRRQRYLRLATEARELADRSPDHLRAACLASAETWERLAHRMRVETSKPVHQITLYHQVRDWLRERSGSCFCDECIAIDVEASRKNVSIATRRLGTEGDFSKYTGKCDSCGTARAVTRAAPDRF